MGHFGPIIEAEKDETLEQYLLNVVSRHQSSLLDLRHPYFSKNHEFHVTLRFLIIIQDNTVIYLIWSYGRFILI
jgi:hypothetical protein